MEYPRPMFRTVRSLTILLAISLSLMVATVAVGSISANRSPWEFWPIYLYIVCTPVAFTTKTLAVLREAERGLSEPTPMMNYLFSLAMLLPIVAGLIPVGIMMRFVE